MLRDSLRSHILLKSAKKASTSIIHICLVSFLILSAYVTWVRVGQINDVPWGCDLFGHLRIAQEFREARAEQRFPDFRLQTPQVSRLIAWFQATHTPSVQWSEMVAPQAHHYVERTQSVIDQYPPGTGFILSLFPEGKAIRGLVLFEVLFILISSLVLLIWTWKKEAWISAGMISLGTYYVFDLLQKHEIGNYSVNAMLLPMILTAFCCLLSRSSIGGAKKYKSLAEVVFAFLGGIFTGISILVRIPYFLQIPGWLFLIPKKLWKWFLLGFALSGVLPLALYQRHAAGAWWASTYNSGDTSLPNWKSIGPYLRFYLIKGPGAPYFIWALVTAIGYWGWYRLSTDHQYENSKIWKSGALFWGISTLFFLTHSPAVLYYLTPAHLSLVVLLSMNVWLREIHVPVNVVEALKKSKKRYFTGIALTPLLASLVLGGVQLARLPGLTSISFPIPQEEFDLTRIPNELLDPQAWVWADAGNGAFWILAKKAAFKLSYGDRNGFSLRTKLFEELRDKNEAQFLVMDGSGSEDLAREYKSLGAKLEERGKVFGSPYFLIHW
jgi:hypothetical protein